MTDKQWYFDEIERMKKEKNAVILAHNYQVPDVQDIADYVGDSLGLSQQAGKTDAGLIVFCGVHFMAETASIISPDKKVIIPDIHAGCSLASSIDPKELKAWKEEHPDAVVVAYVNTTAEIKALTDYCVTSSNAEQVVNAIPEEKKILFLPDKFLGQYIKRKTGRDMEIWQGACHVHAKIGNMNMDEAEEHYPNADILVHPECGCSTSCMVKSLEVPAEKNKIHIHSTAGMINHVQNADTDEFLVATETGIIHQMQKHAPGKKFYPVSERSICEYMKMITLEKLHHSLKYELYEVKVDTALAERARIPIERMLEIV